MSQYSLCLVEVKGTESSGKHSVLLIPYLYITFLSGYRNRKTLRAEYLFAFCLRVR